MAFLTQTTARDYQKGRGVGVGGRRGNGDARTLDLGWLTQYGGQVMYYTVVYLKPILFY